eukprot:2192573-Rhodomonas_salina.1
MPCPVLAYASLTAPLATPLRRVRCSDATRPWVPRSPGRDPAPQGRGLRRAAPGPTAEPPLTCAFARDSVPVARGVTWASASRAPALLSLSLSLSLAHSLTRTLSRPLSPDRTASSRREGVTARGERARRLRGRRSRRCRSCSGTTARGWVPRAQCATGSAARTHRVSGCRELGRGISGFGDGWRALAA